MKKYKQRYAILFTSALLAASFLVLPSHTHISAASKTDGDTIQNFEDMNAYEDDPQAYKEYEKQAETAEMASQYSGSLSSAYKHANKFKSYDVIKGIDVSVYQSEINWKKVKKSGVDFAFIRAAYRGYGSGAIVNDVNYQTNIENAIAAGVDVGVYIYSQAISVEEAIEEAQYLAGLVQGYDIHLPLVMDFEYASTPTGLGGRLYKAKLSKATATDICNAFCETAEAMGYTAIVYANRSMLEAQVYADEISASYDIWLANYVNETKYKGDYAYWQYSSTGSVKGISGNVDCNFRYMKAPAAPDNLVVDNSTYTENEISWSKVPGVYGYHIYRMAADGSYAKIATVTGAGNVSYTDKNLLPGTDCNYKIRAFYKLSDGDILSSYSTALSAATPSVPYQTLVAANVQENSLSLHWAKDAASSGYQLYRSTDGIEYTLLASLTAADVSYTDSNLSPATLYHYRLVGTTLGADGEPVYPAPDQGIALSVSTLCPAPQGLHVSAYKKTSITLKWTACPQASSYHIEQHDPLDNSYEEIAVIPADTETYTITDLSANTLYQFRIRCSITHAADESLGAPGEPLACLTQAAAPKSFAASKTTPTKITLSWNNAGTVTGYEIFRYNKKTKKYEKIKTIRESVTTSYTNKGLDKNTGYSYQIRAFRQLGDTVYYGAFSAVSYAATSPTKVTALKAEAKKTSIKLRWKKVAGATGYTVYRYNTKTKKYTKIKTLKTNSYTVKNLKKNTSYTYKVVAYKSYKGVKYESAAVKITAKTKKR
ncbi:MAG: fibronectin type III domain-containing protein [Lachnospiraceae bacterium]|nr:fibronectin type III domain-containing protein [Lachnospiraceae bacterium]